MLTTLFKIIIVIIAVLDIVFLLKSLRLKELKAIVGYLGLLIVLIILFFLPNMLNTPAAGKNQDHTVVLKIGTEGAYFPWNYVTATGKAAGFDVDVAKEVAKRINRKAEVVVTPWESLIPQLDNNQFDVIASAMSITNERAKNVDFSVPYAQSRAGFFGKKNTFAPNQNAKLTNLKKILKGKVIGVQSGTTFPQYLSTEFKGIISLKYYANQSQLMMDVKSGRIDAGFSEVPSVMDFIKTNKNIIFFGPQLGIADSPLFGKGIAMAVAKGNTKLLTAINSALQSMNSDGTIMRLSCLYFGSDLSYSGKKQQVKPCPATAK